MFWVNASGAKRAARTLTGVCESTNPFTTLLSSTLQVVLRRSCAGPFATGFQRDIFHYACNVLAARRSVPVDLCAAGDDGRERERNRMVDTQIAGREITDPKVLAALRKVPRHRCSRFAPAHR